ncbi:HSPB1-associated protein 1 [Bombyx mori]|uniref:JmjC domain-containing protein n=1 Tax=Bombyx mori TaxID=7091 RepID=A0A8R2AML1_BOMMO|nr:HSPB1-associated protein 1 [Bombyx mori]
MSTMNEDIVRNIVVTANKPIVFRKFVNTWPLSSWNVEKWTTIFGNKEIPFRCMKKDFRSDEPCWERRCEVKSMTFKQFIDNLDTSEEWMYFDYKYVHKWFVSEDELYKDISWKDFGFPNKGASDTTLWIGSKGSHTPAHQDTYGVNIVAQLYGKKRWILFPPETGGLKPTRVPYEESSIYSELNFHCPSDLEQFKHLTGARVVDLTAGDALVVPRAWWHYVQNMDPLNISLNTWLPHEKDTSTQVSEALIKIFVAQICKDLPEDTAKLLINPNEDDISVTPLVVLFLQLEMVAKSYLDNRRKTRRAKRQKTCEENQSATESGELNIEALIQNECNKLEVPPPITGEQLVDMIRQNLREYVNFERPLHDDEIDGSTSSLCLTKALIDAFTQSNVIDIVKENLFARLS